MFVVIEPLREKRSYTITFKIEGVVVKTQQVRYGESAIPPTDEEIRAAGYLMESDLENIETYEMGEFGYRTYSDRSLMWGENERAGILDSILGLFLGWDTTDYLNVEGNMVIAAKVKKPDKNSYSTLQEDVYITLKKGEKVLWTPSADQEWQIQINTANGNIKLEKKTWWWYSKLDSYVVENGGKILSMGSLPNKKAYRLENVGDGSVTFRVSKSATYTVVFKDHDGSVLKEEKVQNHGSVVPPEEPKREDFIFKKWSTYGFDDVTSDLMVIAEYVDTRVSMDEAFKKALLITNHFEGGKKAQTVDYAILGNYQDGCGVSVGCIQFNLKYGSLQSLLLKMKNNHETLMRQIFTNGKDEELFKMLEMESAKDQISWAEKTLYNGKSFKADWKDALLELCATKEFIKIQEDEIEKYRKNAVRIYNEYDFKTERGFAFDVSVQNHSTYADDQEEFNSIVNEPDEMVKLQRILKMMEKNMSGGEFWNDTKTRKNTIVQGTGTVHGKSYNLSSNPYNLEDRRIK